MNKAITKYEYDEKGRVVKQTVYKDDKIENEFIVVFNDKNNTRVEVGYNITTFTQYDKDGDIIFMKYYGNPKPYSTDMDEKNIYYKEEYKYNENKTKVTVNMKNKEGKTTLIYEIDRYFCEAINDYLDTKIVCIVPDDNKIAYTTTFKYNDKGLVIESINK